jgi:CRISPR-associated endonuclease/helicase Cas3
MKTIKAYIQNALRVNDKLKNPDFYLAHLPSTDVSIKAETLSEHLDLVFKYFQKICTENNLDLVIDQLINNIAIELASKNREVIAEYIKQLFVDTIVFHDFGKVNENFQTERMRNNLFKKVATVIKPEYGHSELGAFIYLVYHLESIDKMPTLGDDEKNFLAFVAFLLVNSINLHHSPDIVEPITRLERSIFIKKYDELSKYVRLYEFPKADLTISYFCSLQEVVETIELYSNQYFPLYALTRLNFSLLTASDYLATSEYMNQKEVKELGLITGDLRDKIIHAARNSQKYNTEAFELAESDAVIVNPIERSSENLNILRQNMAVAVIKSVWKNANKYLFYLEAPTGGGKTNLSMLVVSELLRENIEINKVFYVFPFTTLITQTHKAILKTLNLTEDEVSVLHSKAGFQTKGEDDNYGEKKTDYINNLFIHYPVCLLTHIRFFDILKTNEKETNYLLHRIANSIVIIDELQTYPPQHWDKILYFIQHYAATFNIRFVLMSATLPRIDKLKLRLSNQLEFTDLLPNAKSYFTNPNFADRVRFRFDFRDKKLEMRELAEIVLEKSKEYASKNQQSIYTIIEFIFKKSATEFYDIIADRFFDRIFVLSGTILEPRRREIINFLKNEKNRDKKVLLITTQVVEAGVDIDMDLGFKNISLIDSDEQLAGRVNRNVKKELCEVYLFKINEPSQLYKHDTRYSVTKEHISKEEHEEILKDKNFEKLYDLVLDKIDKVNGLKEIQNFNSDYLPYIQRLDFYQVHKKFEFIEQESLSVFVPLDLCKHILSGDNSREFIFSKQELELLFDLGVDTEGDSIDGIEVWKAYKLLLDNKSKGFIDQQVDKKMMAGILSKFTFSVFSNDKIKSKLESFGFPAYDDENDLRGFKNYIYLAHHTRCYDYEKGLIETQFEASENFIL